MDVKKQRGRPKKYFFERKDNVVKVRLSPIEHDRLKMAAKEAGMTVSDFVRAQIKDFLYHEK